MVFAKKKLGASVFNWFELNGPASYDAEKSKRSKAMPNSDKNKVSKMKKLVRVLHFLANEEERMDFVPWNVRQDGISKADWAEKVSAVINTGISTITEAYITNKWLEPPKNKKRKRNADSATQEEVPELTITKFHLHCNEYKNEIGMHADY